MSLLVWMPLNGNLNNQGLLDTNIVTNNTGAISVDSGKIGKCYQFDGTDDRLYINYGKNILCGELTITMWIKPLSSLNNKMIFGGNTGSPRLYVGVKNNTYNIAYGDKPWGRTTSATVKLNTWQFIVIKVKNETASLYCDGKLADSVTANNVSTFPSNFVIPDSYTGYCSNMQVNDIRIYDEIISEKYLKLLQQCLVLHYPLGNIDGLIGGRNLLKLSNRLISSSSYNLADYYFGNEVPVDGEQYTIQMKGVLGDGKVYFGIYNSGGSISLTSLYPSSCINGIYTKTFIWRTSTSPNTYLRVYHMSSSITATSTIEWIKLEKSNKPTPWTPAPEDTPEFYDDIIYDCSGYSNNGVISGDSPSWNNNSLRYSGCYDFNGNTSIQIPHPIFYDNINQCHTVCAWVNLKGNTTQQYLTDFNLKYFLVYSTSTHKTLMYLNGGANDSYVYGSALPLNEWVHVAWVLDTSTQRCEVYYNGTLHARSSNYTATDIPSGVNKNVTLCDAVNGRISDIRIYGTALSSVEIKDLYRTSASLLPSGTLLLSGEVIER